MLSQVLHLINYFNHNKLCKILNYIKLLMLMVNLKLLWEFLLINCKIILFKIPRFNNKFPNNKTLLKDNYKMIIDNLINNLFIMDTINLNKIQFNNLNSKLIKIYKLIKIIIKQSICLKTLIYLDLNTLNLNDIFEIFKIIYKYI